MAGKEWNGDRKRKLADDIFIHTQEAKDNEEGAE